MADGYFLKGSGINEDFLLALHLSESQVSAVLDCMMDNCGDPEVKKIAECLSKDWITYEGRDS